MAMRRDDERLREARQSIAQSEVEAVVRSFRQDPQAWQDLRRQLMQAQSDDERVQVLVNFATSEDALARFSPRDPVGPAVVAATPTVTTVTVTTVTTV